MISLSGMEITPFLFIVLIVVQVIFYIAIFSVLIIPGRLKKNQMRTEEYLGKIENELQSIHGLLNRKEESEQSNLNGRK